MFKLFDLFNKEKKLEEQTEKENLRAYVQYLREVENLDSDSALNWGLDSGPRVKPEFRKWNLPRDVWNMLLELEQEDRTAHIIRYYKGLEEDLPVPFTRSKKDDELIEVLETKRLNEFHKNNFTKFLESK